jgi:hypothetical protein
MSIPCAAVATVAGVGFPVSWSMLGLFVLVISFALHDAARRKIAGRIRRTEDGGRRKEGRLRPSGLRPPSSVLLTCMSIADFMVRSQD